MPYSEVSLGIRVKHAREKKTNLSIYTERDLFQSDVRLVLKGILYFPLKHLVKVTVISLVSPGNCQEQSEFKSEPLEWVWGLCPFRNN